MQRLNAYLVFWRLSTQDALVFRAEFWGRLIQTLVAFAVGYYLWSAVFLNYKTLGGFRVEQMMLYLCGSLLLYGALQFSLLDFVSELYRSGSLSIELARPLSFPLSALSRAMGSSFTSLLIRGLPLFAIGLVLLPVEKFRSELLLLFFPLILLGILINFLIELLLVQLLPILETSWGLRYAWTLCRTILSGVLIPLPFFPDSWFQFFSFFPIHLIFYTPISILVSAKIPLSPFAESLRAYGLPLGGAVFVEQMVWIVLLSLIVHVSWKFSSREFVLQGG